MKWVLLRSTPRRSKLFFGHSIGAVALIVSMALHGAAFATLGFSYLALDAKPSTNVEHTEQMELITVEIQSAAPFASGSPQQPCRASDPTVSATETPVKKRRLRRRGARRPIPPRASQSESAVTAPLISKTLVVSNATSASEPEVLGNSKSGAQTYSKDNQGARNRSSDGRDVEQYGRMIHARIARALRYPESATREGLQGRVALQIVIASDGQLREVSVVGDGANRAFRRVAVDAVNRAAPFPPLPTSADAPGQAVRFRVPIRFFFPP